MKPGEPVSKNDAAVLLRAVQRKLQQPLTMRPMPTARPESHARAVRIQAAQMLAEELLVQLEAGRRERAAS